MFNCSTCNKAIGPKVSPIKVVTGTRRVEYHNEFQREDEFGNRKLVKVDSFGSENTGERIVCPECANEPAVTSSHTIIGGKTFQEKLADPLRVKLIAGSIDNMLERLNHNTKRAAKDTNFAVPNIKQYVDANKDFVF